MVRRIEMDPDHLAELEDRAAELVDRDWLLNQERDDVERARAEHQEHDRAVFTARADEWERIKARSGHTCGCADGIPRGGRTTCDRPR